MGILKKIFITAALVGGAILTGIILVDLYIAKESGPYIFANIDDVPKTPAGVILGASVRDNQMSDMLKDRADAALDLYKKGKIGKILISGDGREENYNEVAVVREYLRKQGVPEEDIYTDESGLDTFDSLARAKEIFQLDKLTVITQSFHLPRAIYLGKNLGIEVYGFPADRHSYANIDFFQFREKIANIKAIINAKLNFQPEILGQPIPIDSLKTVFKGNVGSQYLHEVALIAVIQKGNKYLILKSQSQQTEANNQWTLPAIELDSNDYLLLLKNSKGYWQEALEGILVKNIEIKFNLNVNNIKYLTNSAVLRDDGTPYLVIAFTADCQSAELTLPDGEFAEFQWVEEKDFKNYEFIGGVYDELMLAAKR